MTLGSKVIVKYTRNLFFCDNLGGGGGGGRGGTLIFSYVRRLGSFLGRLKILNFNILGFFSEK